MKKDYEHIVRECAAKAETTWRNKQAIISLAWEDYNKAIKKLRELGEIK